ncbi:MAG: hypothetical protein CL881_03860 [Dehalococcoidia bacterium]|nr:hypothetical protein [Dehalococcoidia bacterium]|tara:strand:- start:432 stop:644 length:213 start_codon:yes stop_codon:yes gene_type:complete
MVYQFYSRTYNYQFEQNEYKDSDVFLFWFISAIMFLLVILTISALVTERRLDRLERVQDFMLLEDRTKEV